MIIHDIINCSLKLCRTEIEWVKGRVKYLNIESFILNLYIFKLNLIYSYKY